MGAALESVVTGLAEALEMADEQGLSKLHLVRDSSTKRWTAIAQRYGGARTAVEHGASVEDAITRALMEAGIQW